MFKKGMVMRWIAWVNPGLKKDRLKGPKHEIFGSGFFTLIKPVWVGDLGTRTKN